MRRTFAILHRLTMCALAFAPLIVTVGVVMTGDWTRPALWLSGTSLLALLIAHIPGRQKDRRGSVSWRVIASALASLLIAAAFLFVPQLYAADTGTLPRICCGLLCAALFLMEMRECSIKTPIFTHPLGVYVGVGLYLGAGTVVWAMDLWVMNTPLYACAASFLVLGTFTLNSESLDVGYASHRTVKPAAGVRRANRRLLSLLVVAVAFIAAFDHIRQWASDAAMAIIGAIMRAMLWFMSLFAPETTTMDSAGGADGAMFPAAEPTETHILWEILYYVALCAVAALLAFLLYKAARIIAQKARELFARIAAHFRRFADTIDEEYTDERTSLFDAGELSRSMRDSIERAIRRMTTREKRWEQMSARERVRFAVRSLYRRAGDLSEKLRPLTIREAAHLLSLRGADPDSLAHLYDRARYSEGEIDASEAEPLRKL